MSDDISTENNWTGDRMHFSLMEQVRLLSSGTLANLTGEKRYDRLDKIRFQFICFAENHPEFETWMEAWNVFYSQ